jgi:hypothetical protein
MRTQAARTSAGTRKATNAFCGAGMKFCRTTTYKCSPDGESEPVPCPMRTPGAIRNRDKPNIAFRRYRDRGTDYSRRKMVERQSMSISLVQRLWLMRLGIPPAKMTKALSLAEQNGLGITLPELAAHHLAGGDAEAVVAGLVFAREHSIRLNWREATAIDLAGASNGESLAEVLAACVEPRTYTFDTFSPDDSEPIVGFTRDGARIGAVCALRYRLTPQHVFGATIERQHERLAVRTAIFINKAADPHALEVARPRHEQMLLSLCAEAGVEDVSLAYRRMSAE